MTKAIRQNSTIVKTIIDPENPFNSTYDAISTDITTILLYSRQLHLNEECSELKNVQALIDQVDIYVKEHGLNNIDINSTAGFINSKQSTTYELLSSLFYRLDLEDNIFNILTVFSNTVYESEDVHNRSYITPRLKTFLKTDLPEIIYKGDNLKLFPIAQAKRLGFRHWDLLQACTRIEDIVETLYSYFDIDPAPIVDQAIRNNLQFYGEELSLDFHHAQELSFNFSKNRDDSSLREELRLELDKIKIKYPAILHDILKSIHLGYAEEVTKWILKFESFFTPQPPVHDTEWSIKESENGDNIVISLNKNYLSVLTRTNELDVKLEQLKQQLRSHFPDRELSRQSMAHSVFSGNSFELKRRKESVLLEYGNWWQEFEQHIRRNEDEISGKSFENILNTDSIIRGLLCLEYCNNFRTGEKVSVKKAIEALNKKYCEVNNPIRKLFRFKGTTEKLAEGTLRRDYYRIKSLISLNSSENSEISIYLNVIKSYNNQQPYPDSTHLYPPRWDGPTPT